MDRELWEQHLALAERHIVDGEATIARQRQIVAELERDGHDTARARALLAQFQHLPLCMSPTATASATRSSTNGVRGNGRWEDEPKAARAKRHDLGLRGRRDARCGRSAQWNYFRRIAVPLVVDPTLIGRAQETSRGETLCASS